MKAQQPAYEHRRKSPQGTIELRHAIVINQPAGLHHPGITVHCTHPFGIVLILCKLRILIGKRSNVVQSLCDHLFLLQHVCWCSRGGDDPAVGPYLFVQCRTFRCSISSGQVLQCPYDFEKAHLVLCEMAEDMALGLFEKKLTTDQLVLTVGYDIDNVDAAAFSGQTTIDRYGRKIPKHAHGTANLTHPTSSMQEITAALSSLYREIGNPSLTVRRLTICANHVVPEAASSAEDSQSAFAAESGVQLDMFSPAAPSNETPQDAESEKNIQQAGCGNPAACYWPNRRRVRRIGLGRRGRYGPL